MGLIRFPQQLPAPQTPVVNPTGCGATKDFRYLLLALLNRTGGENGLPSLDDGAAVVAGVNYLIKSDWTHFATVPPAGVAQLPAMVPSTEAIIFNDINSGNILRIIPQSGAQIDGTTLYNIGLGKMQWFRAITSSMILSMQLG